MLRREQAKIKCLSDATENAFNYHSVKQHFHLDQMSTLLINFVHFSIPNFLMYINKIKTITINTVAPLTEDLCRKLNVTSFVSVAPDPSKEKWLSQFSNGLVFLPPPNSWKFRNFFCQKVKHLSLLWATVDSAQHCICVCLSIGRPQNLVKINVLIK